MIPRRKQLLRSLLRATITVTILAVSWRAMVATQPRNLLQRSKKWQGWQKLDDHLYALLSESEVVCEQTDRFPPILVRLHRSGRREVLPATDRLRSDPLVI